MNKLFALSMAIVFIGIGPNALSSDPSNLPPGISADNWITVGDRFGFVVTNGDSLVGSAAAVGVAKGYFMLRRQGVWLRIESTPSFAMATPPR